MLGEGSLARKFLTKRPPHPTVFVDSFLSPLPHGERAQIPAPAFSDAVGVAKRIAPYALETVNAMTKSGSGAATGRFIPHSRWTDGEEWMHKKSPDDLLEAN